MKSLLVDVEIKGSAALLQHRFGEQAEISVGKQSRRVNINERDPREEATAVAYIDKNGELYHPAAAIIRLLREAGAGHKQKGTRKAIKYIVPAAVRSTEETIPLFNGDGGRAKHFEVDSRPVVIPATKGRIMRHRPRLDTWSAKFTLAINEDILSNETIHQLLTEGGESIGIGDYRPMFGTFQVMLWKPRT